MSGGTKPIRVLLVSDSYPPVLGGSEVEAQRVSAALIARGHQVRVLCAGGPPMPPVTDWVDPEGVPVKILTRHSRGRRKDILFSLRVARHILSARNDYDVIYFLMQGLQIATGLPLARLLRKPTVMKIAGSGVIPAMRLSRAGRVELNWLQQWKIPLMILNDGMIEEAEKDGFSRDQLVWMPNPVDVNVFRPPLDGEALAWRRSHGLPPDAPLAVYVGRLSREKGVPPLLRGFAVAARRSPKAMLLLVGDGALRPELEEMAKEFDLGPDRIRFVGRVPIDEVPFWLRASDVYALTSPSEGFSCALLEAMAVGLPSVVSAIPANLQLVDDGVHGLTVPWDDGNRIGEAFLRLFEDAAFRQRMGGVARQRVIDNYSTDKVLDRYESLFRNMLKARS